MVTFPTNTSITKTLQMYLICKQFQMLLFVYKWWKPHFLISKRFFADFSRTTLTLRIKFHTQSLLNITQLLVPKSQYVWKKVWGMRLWIGTSTFNMKTPNRHSMLKLKMVTVQIVHNGINWKQKKSFKYCSVTKPYVWYLY